MSTENDPTRTYQFVIKVDGTVNATAYFSSVEGLENNSASEHPAVTVDGHEYVQMQPGRVKWGELVFRKGLARDMALWMWRERVTDGNATDFRATLTVTLCDREYQPTREWSFPRAWPSKIASPYLSSESGEVAIEELTIHHEGMAMPRDWSGGPPV
jgi:phage tail-like protein